MDEEDSKESKAIKVIAGKFWLPIGAGLVAFGLILGFVFNYGWQNIFGTNSESRSSQVVQSLERHEEIVLLSLGIQGIAEEREQRTVFGANIPGTGRTLFLQYGFRAKLGLDGEDVRFEAKGEDTILIRVPEFIFIGHDDITFKTALEDNGILSWVTPDIDQPALISRLLTPQHISEHVETNRDILEMQTEMFYEGIIHAVDPEITVLFDFTDSKIAP